jgi:hypothetical protein
MKTKKSHLPYKTPKREAIGSHQERKTNDITATQSGKITNVKMQPIRK